VTESPVLSIIIVNWNVRDLLRECLLSIRKESTVEQVEVIAVDNNSTDGSVAMVRAEFPWVRLVVHERNLGFARGNNSAVHLCRGRYLLLLNPDTVVVDRAVDRLIDWMDHHPRAAIAGCRLLNTDGSLQRWTGGAFPSLANVLTHNLFLDAVLAAPLRPRPLYRVGDGDADEQVEWVSGACLIVRRGALREKLFDESYFKYAEDMELCERLASRGWEVWYTPSASIVHHHGRSVKQQSGQIALSPVRGPRTFFARNRGPVRVFLYDLMTASGFFLRWLGLSAISIVRPPESYRTRAGANRQLMIRAVQIMRGR